MMTADQWPDTTLRVAVAAEPERVHLLTSTQALSAGWGRAVPHELHAFSRTYNGELRPRFRVAYYCMGPHGAAQLVLHIKIGDIKYNGMAWPIEAVDLGYHSHKPLYGDQHPAGFDCHLLGHPCYYDGSSLSAEEALGRMIVAGPEKWEAQAFTEVLDYYERTFTVTIDRETLRWQPAVEATA